MSTAKDTRRTPQTSSPGAEQWRAFEREMAERAEAHLAALQRNSPQEIYHKAGRPKIEQ